MTAIVVTAAAAVTAAGRGAAALMGEPISHLDRHGERWPLGRIDPSVHRWPAGDRLLDLRKYVGAQALPAMTALEDALDVAGPLSDRATLVVLCAEPDSTDWPAVAELVAPENDPRPPARRIYEDLIDFHVLRGIPAGLAQLIALRAGARHGAVVVHRPCSGGLTAIEVALRSLRTGEVEVAIVVGTDALPMPAQCVAFDGVDRLGDQATLGRGPFDRERRGGFLGEGAAALVLESQATAAARGARPIARIAACETHIARTPELALRAALGAAGPGPIGVVLAHASGSIEGDALENRALGASLPGALVTSTKGAIGVSFAASALIDAAVACECLSRGRAPAIALLRDPIDSELEILCEPALLREGRVLVTALNGLQIGAAGALVLEEAS